MTRERQFGIDIMGAGGIMGIGDRVNATVSSNSQKKIFKKSAIPLDLFNGAWYPKYREALRQLKGRNDR